MSLASRFCILLLAASAVRAQSPFAARVVEYDPAPGQFVNLPEFNDPLRALGPPVGGGLIDGNDQSVVTLGGFGGRLVLAFDHRVEDHRANPLGLDFIVFGNAFYVARDPYRRWAEAAYLEVSRDDNQNGLADDPWYLIPGSHLSDPASRFQTQTWDADVTDSRYPPAFPTWIPPDHLNDLIPWTTSAYRLPDLFDTPVLENPNGPTSPIEGVFGYADCSPTLILGDRNGDGIVDDPIVRPAEFYTWPDDPRSVGISLGSGGGDAFDIAWAIDPATQAPADLDGIDFVGITNGVNAVAGPFGEMSPEIDAVADVREGLLGDADADLDVDLADHETFLACVQDGNEIRRPVPCRVMDFIDDRTINLADWAGFQRSFTGDLP